MRFELDRRRFLLGAAALGAAGPLACATSPSNSGTAPEASNGGGSGTKIPSGKTQLGVVLLGLGNYAETRLAPGLTKTRNCALRGIVTGTPAKVPVWQERYSITDRNVYDYASFPQIANNSEIDVVYVVVPPALHAQYAIAAAEAGKHVWCEKPMAMNAEECQRIIDACRANRVSLSIGYRMQHEPNTQTVIQYGKQKPYGAIRSVRAVAGDRMGGEPSWRMVKAMGGGALYDMGVYAINAIRYATGEEPVRVVRARQWADRPELFTEVDESTEFELELPSGVIAYGKASRFQPENVLRVEAQNGWYQLEPMQSYEGVKGQTSDGKALDQPIDHQQARQMDDDALAILEGRPAMVPGEEGQRDIRIVQAIVQAAQSGAAVAL
jgi:glucose-fructose oxidoreductase